MLGLRTGIWAPGVLIDIFGITFYFALLYAVSVLFGVLTRSPIVASVGYAPDVDAALGRRPGLRSLTEYRERARTKGENDSARQSTSPWTRCISCCREPRTWT